MISPDKIDEWIREVEERPASAELIIRYIANRLSELASREEELAAQNIELLSGRKVDEYVSRIASLEYLSDQSSDSDRARAIAPAISSLVLTLVTPLLPERSVGLTIKGKSTHAFRISLILADLENLGHGNPPWDKRSRIANLLVVTLVHSSELPVKLNLSAT